MSVYRDAWQKFKKKFPDFEKNKAFKAALGPNIDKYDASYVESFDLFYKLLKKVDETIVHGNQMMAILKSYEDVAKYVDNNDMKRELLIFIEIMQGTHDRLIVFKEKIRSIPTH